MSERLKELERQLNEAYNDHADAYDIIEAARLSRKIGELRSLIDEEKSRPGNHICPWWMLIVFLAEFGFMYLLVWLWWWTK